MMDGATCLQCNVAWERFECYGKLETAAYS